MTKGQIVTAPDGEHIVLAEIGQVVLVEDVEVRVWEVSLAPGEVQPWHLHHNPYLVLCLQASAGRMDWLDGSAPRFLNETRGGAVFRPTSPVHRLTNIGDSHYRNRLIEFKAFGENRAADAGAFDAAATTAVPADDAVLSNELTAVCQIVVPPAATISVPPAGHPQVLLPLDPAPLADDPTGGVRLIGDRATDIANSSTHEQTHLLVELRYLGPAA